MILNSAAAVLNIQKLFKNELLSDIEFQLKKTSGAEIKIPAHKVILAASSPVFEKMFVGDQQHGPIVKIPDISVDAFVEFLQFFYLTDIDLTTKNIADVFKLVKKYDVSAYWPICEKFVEETIAPEHSGLYYELSLRYNLSEYLVKRFESTVCEELIQHFKSDTPVKHNYFIMKNILKSNKLACKELTVFNGVILWVSTLLKIQGMRTSVDNIKAELGDCLHEIRFPLMDMQDFMNCLERYPNLLTSEEFFEMINFIAEGRPLTVSKFNTEARDLPQIHSEISFGENPKIKVAIDNASIQFQLTHHKKGAKTILLRGFEIQMQLTSEQKDEFKMHTICDIDEMHGPNMVRSIFKDYVEYTSEEKSDPSNKCKYTYIFPNAISIIVGKQYKICLHLFDQIFGFIFPSIGGRIVINDVEIRFMQASHLLFSKLYLAENT